MEHDFHLCFSLCFHLCCATITCTRMYDIVQSGIIHVQYYIYYRDQFILLHNTAHNYYYCKWQNLNKIFELILIVRVHVLNYTN